MEKSDIILEDKKNYDEIEKIFGAYDDAMTGEICISFLIQVLEDEGLRIKHDIRLRDLRKYFQSFPRQYNSYITKEQFHRCFELPCGNLLK